MSEEYVFKAKHVYTDDNCRQYSVMLDPQEVEEFYLNIQRKFWSARDNAKGDDLKLIVHQQDADYLYGTKQTLSDLLQKFIKKKRSEKRTNISILELGCANGPTLRHLAKVAGDLNVEFTGLELTPCLIEDMKIKFPNARGYVGGTEELILMTEQELGHEKFDIFLASGVLCQMPPDKVLEALRFAGQYCRSVMIWEYMINIEGELSIEYPVIFKHTELTRHLLFAHPYKHLLQEAGFDIENIKYYGGAYGQEKVEKYQGSLVASNRKQL